MDIVTLSFSQNTRVEKNISFQISEMIGEVIKQPVRHLNLRDYNVMPCHLCAECADSHMCELDKAFRTLLNDLGNPDVIFMVVPYYSPFPSKLMIFFEKLNEIFYSAWINDQSYKNPLQETPVGLLVHGGLVHSEDTMNHYHTMMSTPIARTLKGLGFKVIEDNHLYKSGFAFGIENESCIKKVKKEVFPIVKHRDDFIRQTIEGYVNFAMNN